MATPDPTPGPIAVDDTVPDNDTDSSLGDDGVSSTASVSSSILDYRRENGRTYHRYQDGRYLYPNDEQENERLDLQHHLWMLTLDGKLGLSPPNDKGASPSHVLDVGTGTGIWAVDYAEEHPESHIVGVDLSPIQPTFVSSNLEFQIDDITQEWTFHKPFDYIHSRVMNTCIQDWVGYFKQCYDNLAPGGWLEVQELDMPRADDGTMGPGTAQHQAWSLLREGAERAGARYAHVDEFKGWMEKAGFTNVVERHFAWPSNDWPRDAKLKEIGRWSNINMREGLEGFLLASMTRGLGWSKEEVTVLAAKVRTELNDRRIHSYNPIVVLYAQKPESKA